jgi:serine/threonine protein kinase/WD40 repeat protein
MAMERQRERDIFLAARDISDPRERRAFVERECGAETNSRQRLLELLDEGPAADSFFESLPPGPPAPAGESLGAATGEPAISHYKLLEVIGEGGFGVVYLAEQAEPIRRRVALKILKQGMDTREFVVRFEAERQALAMLDHPNIARVLEAGATEKGRPYFVMELVPGCSITRYCDENRLRIRERLELFIKVCLAVQHAHQQGIIHRDLKPSNILVATRDGHPEPKIIDFGVAKAVAEPLTSRALSTRYGRMLGTPAYMSPEQAELGGANVDTRSDIYSLGVVLYELLAGQPPLAPERLSRLALVEMQQIIREEEPPRPSVRLDAPGSASESVAERRGTTPRDLGRLLSGDLDWIAMKALEKDRRRRYASASALIEDIERHLREEPVMAGPPRLGYRLGKFVRRHRRVTITALLGLGFLLLGFLLALAGFVQASRERDRAVAAEDLSDRQRKWALQEAELAHRREAQQRLTAYTSDMSLAKAALDLGDAGRARALLDRQRPGTGQPDLREWEWRYLWKQCQSDALATLYHHSNSIYSLAISADSREAAIGGFDGALLLLNLESRQICGRLQDSGPPCLAQYSPHAKLLAATDSQGRLRLWRTAAPFHSDPLEGPGQPRALAFSGDGGRLAAVEPSGRLWIWDATSHKVITNYSLNTIYPDSHSGGLVFSTAATVLWVSSAWGDVVAVEVSTGRVLRTWRAHPGLITTLALSPDGTSLVSGSGFMDSSVTVWDPAQGTPRAVLEGHRAWISAVTYSPDGRWLASASADQTIRLWDTTRFGLAQALRGHRHEVWSLAFSPDNRLLISGDKDGIVNLWRSQPQAPEPCPISLPGTMPDPVFLATNSVDMLFRTKPGKLLRWDGDALQELNPTGVLSARVKSIHGSVARGAVVCLTERNALVLDSTTLELLADIPLAGGGQRDPLVVFSGDGRYLLLVTGGVRVRVIETLAWQTLAEWQPGGAPLAPIQASPDGALLATGGERVRIYKLPGGDPICSFEAHKLPTAQLAFSPDGRLLATAGRDGGAKLWEVGAWRELAELRGHLLGIRCLAFSPNSRRLATGSADREAIKLWDLPACREALNLAVPKSSIVALSFSPDGNTLCAFGQDEQQSRNYLWRVPSPGEIASREKPGEF